MDQRMGCLMSLAVGSTSREMRCSLLRMVITLVRGPPRGRNKCSDDKKGKLRRHRRVICLRW